MTKFEQTFKKFINEEDFHNDPIGDEQDVLEFLNQFRQDNPELFTKFASLLNSHRFINQVQSMRPYKG